MCRQRCGIKETPAHNGNVNYYTQRSLEKLTMEPLYIYIYIYSQPFMSIYPREMTSTCKREYLRSTNYFYQSTRETEVCSQSLNQKKLLGEVVEQQMARFSDQSLSMFIAALRIAAKKWKQLTYLSTFEWIKKWVPIHIGIVISHKKRIRPCQSQQHGWNCRSLTQHEKSHAQKNKYHLILMIHEVKKKQMISQTLKVKL